MGVIMAGGKSTRMGRDKATLLINAKIHAKGVRLIDHVADVISDVIEPFGGEVVVSGNVDGYLCVSDRQADIGPIGGMWSVISSFAHALVEWFLFVPVDMPLLEVELLMKLVHASRHERDAEAIMFSGYQLPLMLRNSPVVVNALEAMCLRGSGSQRSINELLGRIRVDCIDVPEGSKRAFNNLNTPEEWRNEYSSF